MIYCDLHNQAVDRRGCPWCQLEELEKHTAKVCYQIASSHEFGTDAAKTIRETFGLEI